MNKKNILSAIQLYLAPALVILLGLLLLINPVSLRVSMPQKTPPANRGRTDQVFLTNFSLHRGQVMEILPLPLGTRTIWRHLGQSKYR